jgi:ABC-2 type transport system permease protein
MSKCGYKSNSLNASKPIILCHVVLSFSASFISAILFTDFLNPITFIPFFLIPFLNSIVTSVLGLLINLYYPKLDWNNEEEVVKKSMSVGLSMGVCLLTSLILPVVYFIVGKTWSFGIFSLIGILLEVVLIIIVFIILKNKGTKKFIDL